MTTPPPPSMCIRINMIVFVIVEKYYLTENFPKKKNINLHIYAVQFKTYKFHFIFYKSTFYNNVLI